MKKRLVREKTLREAEERLRLLSLSGNAGAIPLGTQRDLRRVLQTLQRIRRILAG